MRLIIFKILLPATLLLATLAAQAKQETLTTATAEYLSVPREYRLDGVVEAIRQTTVSAQTHGQIQEILGAEECAEDIAGTDGRVGLEIGKVSTEAENEPVGDDGVFLFRIVRRKPRQGPGAEKRDGHDCDNGCSLQNGTE